MNRIKELRKEKGWTQQQLADKVGLRDSTVRMWELGKSEPRGKTIKQLAELFGVTADYILECDNKQKTIAHANRLRELRKAKGLTTEELGKAIGLDSSMITHIERGDKNFSVDSLIRTCDYFGVSADYMLKRERIEIPSEVKAWLRDLYQLLFQSDLEENAADAAVMEIPAYPVASDKQSDGCPNRLRELRKAKGLTSIQVAKVLQLSESAVRYIERGDRDFSIASLTRICDYFGVTTDYMLKRTGVNINV